jgi:FkbM family methyltransferase
MSTATLRTLPQPQPKIWNPTRDRGVVFDIGMHDGSDTAFYLHQGYAVVAVEADPILAAQGRQRFLREIDAGQLTILNVGIAAEAATATFWICEDHSVWNSFDKRIATRNGSRCHPVQIETWRFSDVLKTFGVPEYAKIDIEGHDALCVRDLDRETLPRFISVESECAADGETLTPSRAVAMVDLLREAGYTRFKLVSQDDFRAVGYPDRWRWVRRLVDSAAYGKLRVPGLAAFARRLSHRGRLHARNAFAFACGSTGPWGAGLPGRWSNYETARATYLALRDEYFNRPGVKTYSFWFDWHASYDRDAPVLSSAFQKHTSTISSGRADGP